MAVHSLKDLPTELPTGLVLGAVAQRADVRDVLIYREAAAAPANDGPRRGYGADLTVDRLPAGAVVATSSTRRKAQLLAINSRLQVPDIRGNVLTRLQKVAGKPEVDATVLALAGLSRLQYTVTPQGRLEGKGVPAGLLARVLEIEVMLPCVGQGAIGIEIRQPDQRMEAICAKLNHVWTFQCVTAERAFLAGMGGGCQSPVAAYARPAGEEIHLRAISFASGPLRRAEASRPAAAAAELGRALATQLKS